MRLARTLIYRLGFRPRLGSIFYSPSLAWRYVYEDYGIADAFKAALEGGQKWPDAS